MQKVNSFSKFYYFFFSYNVDFLTCSCLLNFFSYTLFPLLLLFDAAVNCRSSMKIDSKDNPLEFNTLETEHKVSDSVAEGVVLCLEEVLKKCHLGSVDQVFKAKSAILFDISHP